jgi:RNA polymerase sigma-54 factor
MQGHKIKQRTKGKLTSQQIAAIQLLQLSDRDLPLRIAQEMEENPALEEAVEEELTTREQTYISPTLRKGYDEQQERRLKDRLEAPTSLQERLHDQLAFLQLRERAQLIGEQILGSLDEHGYLTRPLEAIAEDMFFFHTLEVSVEEVAHVLRKVQTFEPRGIGARDLKEALLLQLAHHRSPAQQHAVYIIKRHFPLFKQKKYHEAARRLNLNEEELQAALALIRKCKPYPRQPNLPMDASRSIQPDFIVTQSGGIPRAMLYKAYHPHLRVNANYRAMLQRYQEAKGEQEQQASAFIREKIKRAGWFIAAIQQRQKTLLATMRTIVKLQQPFFATGDETLLKPIFLRDVTEHIGMDISTISRVVSKKYVQTDWKIYPLKYFFSEGIPTRDGEAVSSRVVKQRIAQLIAAEDKQKPCTDEVLMEALRAAGYLIARRTVAKYRTQLKLLPARLRKES